MILVIVNNVPEKEKVMEKNLIKMKKEIESQNRFYGALAVIGIAAESASASGILTSHYKDASTADFLQGFILGLVLVIEIVAIYNIVKNRKALKDDAQLKRLYNEMHDERTQQIEAMSGKASIKIAMIISLIASIIVSYFSKEEPS